MSRILVVADIHGSLNAWLTVRALLNPTDDLAIAGDLFDTRYGNFSNSDFQPGDIRSDLNNFDHSLYYVYGNCDVASYFPGHDTEMMFNAFGKKIGLHHGHRPFPTPDALDIIIQGHTHICHLAQQEGTIYLNPGSIARPRNHIPSYGIIDSKGVSLVELKTGNTLATIPFIPPQSH